MPRRRSEPRPAASDRRRAARTARPAASERSMTSRRPMEPRDLARIRFVSDPQISPDGARVAFVVTQLSEERDEYLSNIWMVDVTGGEPRRFTTGPKRDTAPRWSPDGVRLAFVSERDTDKKPQLYVMRTDGGEPRRLTDLANGISDPVWSPDGTRLAFVARVGGWQEPESEHERKKSRPARVITSLKYRWNAEGFTYDRRPHVFAVSAEGGAPTQITDGDYADADPAWSPDGTQLAFVSARHATRDEDDQADVWLVSSAGGEPRRVTDTSGTASVPTFSPDGAEIAFARRVGANSVGDNVQLSAVPATGGAPRALAPSLDRSLAGPIRPIWCRDGRIVFPVEDRGDVVLYRIAAPSVATREGGDP